MIAMIAVAALSLAVSGTQATGDFDGDGAADTAVIVVRPDGSREVVVTLDVKTPEIVVARVDQYTVLNLVPPDQVAAACRPLTGIVPECSGAVARLKRTGLAFRRVQQEMVGLAVWDGARFATLIGQGITQAGPAAVTPPPPVSTTPAIRRTVLSLDVGSSGRVEACRVVEASGSTALDAKACAIAVDKARYATTAGGKPMQRQTRRLSIAWPGPN